MSHIELMCIYMKSHKYKAACSSRIVIICYTRMIMLQVEERERERGEERKMTTFVCIRVCICLKLHSPSWGL
jgi:hypothetical protein